MIMEKYPAALHQPNMHGQPPLHLECINQCRSAIISNCIDLYPESVHVADEDGCLRIHAMLKCKSSPIDQVLLMMEK
jgi:hypothetical protein